VDSDEAINDMVIKKVLREVRTEATDKDPSWVDDADIDEELQAKSLSMRILVNQALATSADTDAEERVRSVFKLLKTFVVMEGEFSKVKDTPKHHKKRLRLLAGLMILKLCTVKKFDDQFDHASFNKLAELVQDTEIQVRRRFMDKLQNYLTRGKLRARFHAILFLTAFEPFPELKNRVETWLRSRARYYAENEQQIMEALMGRLIPLLAHHPDYSSDPADLVDFANYFLFYLGAVATEGNVSLIYKYAERVKQTRDGVDPEKSENLYVLSDLAQALTRKFQERKNWSFQAWPGKVGLPTGLYTALPSSEVAQHIAQKQYIPESLDEKLDDLIRAMDRKKV
jgi:sister-chromatid-cohesion protein PDS5